MSALAAIRCGSTVRERRREGPEPGAEEGISRVPYQLNAQGLTHAEPKLVGEHDGRLRPGLRSGKDRDRCGVRASRLETKGQPGAERSQRSPRPHKVSCSGEQVSGPGISLCHGGHCREQLPAETT